MRNLEEIAETSKYLQSPGIASQKYLATRIEGYVNPEKVLEMGPAEGVMTELILGMSKDLTLLEGSQIFSQQLQQKFPSVTVVNSMFEDYEPNERFSTIIMGHVLEHVHDPVSLLLRVKKWLRADGNVICAVPNARSLHRQAAVLMGLLETEETLNEMDVHHGHHRVFTPESFRNSFLKSSFKIKHFGGYLIKTASNQQIIDTWTPEMLDAFMEIGERYPDIAAEILIVAEVQA